MCPAFTGPGFPVYVRKRRREGRFTPPVRGALLRNLQGRQELWRGKTLGRETVSADLEDVTGGEGPRPIGAWGDLAGFAGGQSADGGRCAGARPWVARVELDIGERCGAGVLDYHSAG